VVAVFTTVLERVEGGSFFFG